MSAAIQTATEKARTQRDRLYRQYRVSKKAQLGALYESEPYGDRLRRFSATLNHFSIDDSDTMIAFVQTAARTWLRRAPGIIREAALEMISDRIIRIRERAGLEPFDDPVFDEDPDVFLLCRRELRL